MRSLCNQTQHSEKYIDFGIFTYQNTIRWKNFSNGRIFSKFQAFYEQSGEFKYKYLMYHLLVTIWSFIQELWEICNGHEHGFIENQRKYSKQQQLYQKLR